MIINFNNHLSIPFKVSQSHKLELESFTQPQILIHSPVQTDLFLCDVTGFDPSSDRTQTTLTTYSSPLTSIFLIVLLTFIFYLDLMSLKTLYPVTLRRHLYPTKLVWSLTLNSKLNLSFKGTVTPSVRLILFLLHHQFHSPTTIEFHAVSVILHHSFPTYKVPINPPPWLVYITGYRTSDLFFLLNFSTQRSRSVTYLSPPRWSPHFRTSTSHPVPRIL